MSKIIEPDDQASLVEDTPLPPTNPVIGQHWRNGGIDWAYTSIGWQRLLLSPGAYPEISDIQIDVKNQEVILIT